MAAHFYQPVFDGVPSRSFATKDAALRFCKRTLNRTGGTAHLMCYTSVSQPGVLVSTITRRSQT